MVYNKRVWLNDANSRSTGSIVAFSGPYKCRDGEIIDEAFLEIADCSGKIRLHMAGVDRRIDFINKLDLLLETISDFSNFLKEMESR